MKITFQEAINQNDWLHVCLMSSLTQEAIDSGKESQSFEVKLLVNGIELEPKTLNDLLVNIEKYIDSEALKIAESKLQKSLQKAQRLSDIVDEVCYKIRGEFDIKPEDDTDGEDD